LLLKQASSGNFSASTDFKVNRAVERLGQTGKVVVVRFDECSTRSRAEERKYIEQFRGMGFILLNDFRMTSEARKDEKEAQRAIWAFVDDLLCSLDSGTVCPDMLDGASQKISLAKVLQANNLEKNERLLV